MVILSISLDTQTVSVSNIAALLAEGQIIHVEGIINIRWDEFSAKEVSRELALYDVEWERVDDDTPGRLEMIILYTGYIEGDLEKRLQRIHGVEEYAFL
jgi:hypothetical protein